MQTFSVCMQCQAENGIPNFSSIAMARIPNDCVIETVCDRGHRTIAIIQEMKFEILSDMAIRAIVDCYYRDAVASFAGALERLFEFFIRATCRKHGINASTFNLAWNEMANMSERQLGAFIGSYLVETGQPPKLLTTNQKKFRNEVIHKGKFPERLETMQFGQAVLECALPILRLLKSAPYSAAVQSLIMESIVDRSERAREAGLGLSTHGIGTFLSLTNQADQQVNVETAVANYASRPDFTAAAAMFQQLGAIMKAGAPSLAPDVEGATGGSPQ